MKTLKIFSMAALALVMAACSSEDNEIQQPAEQGKMHFTATIAAPNSGATIRTTITPGTGVDAGKYFVAWADGDEIALIYDDNAATPVRHLVKARVTAVDGSGNATISATLEGTVDDQAPVTLVYPYDIVEAPIEDDMMLNKPYLANFLYFTMQRGAAPTDETYGISKYDWREGSDVFSVSGSNATISSPVTMTSNIAIWKFNLTDGSSPLASNIIEFKCGEDICDATLADASEAYLYVPIPILEFNKTIKVGAPFEIQATSGGKTYSYSHSAVTLTGGKIYESTIALSPLIEFWIDDGDHSEYLYYCDGETWANAINNHRTNNRAWSVDGVKLKFDPGWGSYAYYLKDDNAQYVDPTSSVKEGVDYDWEPTNRD